MLGAVGRTEGDTGRTFRGELEASVQAPAGRPPRSPAATPRSRTEAASRIGLDAPASGRLRPVGDPQDMSADDVGRARPGLLASLRRDPAFWIGGGLALAFLLAGLLAPWLSPWDPDFQDRSLAAYPSAPGPGHPLGADLLGRDVLSRILFGARIALVVGVGAAVVATLIGFAVGLVAANARSPRIGIRLPGGSSLAVPVPVESLMMRTTDVFLSLPALLLAMALAAVLGPSVGLTGVVIAALLWTGTARIAYGRTRAVRDAEFVVAARALGTSSSRIVLRHVAPHVVPLAIAYGAITIAAAILFEATLSYLGAGVPVPTPSWGGMVAEHIDYYLSDPPLVMLPGAAILLTVLAFTLLGDALRDALDPATRR